ncbi:MAG TPA: hypothetical protein VFW49_05395 [Fluviicoccus sp.]|nr:hypothetical protein [Fluviicoccus sp.]
MRTLQSGSISVEYSLSVTIFIIIVVLGVGHDQGVADLMLHVIQRIYADYTAMLGAMDSVL